MACLNDTAVAGFASGTMGTAERALAEAHAEQCAECRRALAAVVARPDDPVQGASYQQHIGRHRVVGLLGSGAMGVVLAAHDPHLDRRVALKLLRGQTDHASRARLVREAQAMARLKHPSVITVYDVGETDRGEVYLAMELVEGGTLRAWLAQRRSWREIIAVFVAAGRGLAAAHAAGIVHRDFKPDNVLVGHDGRVRVTDFGLARADAPSADGDTSLLELDLTVTGAFVGTPAYMPPEQFAARACDERSDQFSFCVALFEALWRKRPFAGGNVREMAESVTAGRIVETPLAGVPAHIRRAILRGLSVSPAARWPAMEPLLDEIARDPARRRRQLAIGGAALAVVAGAVVASGAWSGGPHPCADSGAAIAAWNPERRAALAAAFAASGVADHGDAFGRVAAQLDSRGERLRLVRRSVCEDTHVRGVASPAMLDLRMACLATVEERIKSLVTALGRADGAAVAAAPGAAALLPEADACRDARRLVDLTAPPADQRLPAVRAKVADAATARVLGRVTEAHTAAVDAAARAAAIGWQPLRAEALQIAAATSSEPTQARTLYREALEAAEAGHDDVQRAEVWMALALDAAEASQLDSLDLFLAMGEAAARRAGDAAAILHARRDRGTALATAGRLVEGAPIVRAACAETVDKLGAISADALRCRGDLVRVAGFSDNDDPGEALALAADLERAYGPWSPDRGDVLMSAAAAQTRKGDLAGAETSLQGSLEIRRRTFGDDSPGVAQVLLSLGELYGRRGQYDKARGVFEHALAMRERLYGANSAKALVAHLMFASIQADAGHRDEALTRLETNLPRFEAALGGDIVELAYAHQLQAELLAATGRAAEALPLYRRAIGQSAAIYGADSAQLRTLKLAAATARLATGDGRGAAAELEPLIAAYGDAERAERADAELTLARALWRSGSRDRARAAATRARDDFAAAGAASADKRAEAEQWLARPR